MANEDLLGAGLDIEGWSYLKGDVAQKISELTDRSLILRSTFPMVLKSKVGATHMGKMKGHNWRIIIE